MRTYNIQNIAAGQGDHYTIYFLINYFYFKEYYKMVAIYLSKRQESDPDQHKKLISNEIQIGQEIQQRFSFVKK